jgi:hypothetical protein
MRPEGVEKLLHRAPAFLRFGELNGEVHGCATSIMM